MVKRRIRVEWRDNTWRYVTADIEGRLAVHIDTDSGLWWTVTHVPTGLRCGEFYDDEAEAKAARARLLKLRLDWSSRKRSDYLAWPKKVIARVKRAVEPRVP